MVFPTVVHLKEAHSLLRKQGERKEQKLHAPSASVSKNARLGKRLPHP